MSPWHCWLLFLKHLLTRIPSVVSEHGTLHYEHLEFWWRHCMTLWHHRELKLHLQAHHLQFNTWLEETMLACLWVKWQKMQIFYSTKSSCSSKQAWLVRCDFFTLFLGPVCEMYANTFRLHWICSPRRWQDHPSHVPPAVATRWLPAELFQHLEHWPYDCRIAISVSKNTVVLFIQTARHIWKLWLVQVFGQPMHWVYTANFLVVTLDAQLICLVHINQVEGGQHRGWAC